MLASVLHSFYLLFFYNIIYFLFSILLYLLAFFLSVTYHFSSQKVDYFSYIPALPEAEILIQIKSKTTTILSRALKLLIFEFFHGAPVAYQERLHYFPHKWVAKGDTAYCVCVFFVLCSVCCIKLPNTHNPLNFIQGSSIPLNIRFIPKGAIYSDIS